MARIIGLFVFWIMTCAAFQVPVFADESGASVKSLYSEYQSALKKKDLNNAFFLAGKTWKQSEDTYGDSKLTGDLAYNYAVLGKSTTKSKRNKRVETAYERSIELASFSRR